MSVRVRMAPEPDGLPAHRRRAHLPLQLAVRARPRAASACCGSRTPTRAARSRRRPSRSSARFSWLGIDWDGPVTFQLDAMDRCRELAHAARRRGQGLRGRGRDPLPHARRGRDRVGRRRPRPDRVPEREARGRRDRPLRRPGDLQLREPGRGHGRRDHARDPRLRPRLEHAEAAPDPARHSGHEPPVYAHVPDVLGDDGKKLSKRHGATVGRRVPHRRVRPRGADELPRAARLGTRRRDDDHEPGRARASASRSSASARARRPSTTRSSTG